MDSPMDAGLHTDLIKDRLPAWINHLTTADIKALGQSRIPAQLPVNANPDWLARATPQMRQRLRDSQTRSRAANVALARTLKDLKGITEFCEPLLKEALRSQFGVEPDLKHNQLYHLRYRQLTITQPLLQAALGNFEANMAFDEVALEQTSAIAPLGALLTEYYGEPRADGTRAARYRYTEKLAMKPAEFSALCRRLDLGKQYQDHLAGIFDAPANKARVREQMISAQKAAMEVRVHSARIRDEITQAGYETLLALLSGQSAPTFNGHPVVCSQLEMFGASLGEIVIIGAGTRATQQLLKRGEPWTALLHLNPLPFLRKQLSANEERIIVYIPGAPLYPIKEYASFKAFEHDLRLNVRHAQYQRLLTGYAKHDEAGHFIATLKAALMTYKWNANAGSNGRYEQVYDDEANLRLKESFFATELFGELHTRHQQRMKANARLLVVPTADVDNEAFWARLKHFAGLGLDFLNVAAFFVPGLGEVMMAVAAVQLSVEVYEGIEAWQEGDSDEAWSHLESVAVNVAFIAALGAAGAAAGKAPVIQVSRWVDGLVPVKLPNGEARLWKPDLAPYRSSFFLDPHASPNALGQFKSDGRTFIKIDGHLHEKVFDSDAGQWRIRHPSNPDAYQPLMQHNGQGAWRHSLERPLEWDRPTLLRRMGPQAEGFTDQELERIADVSGISDDALRKMHVDNLPMPPLLRDTLRQFQVDRQVNNLIRQMRSDQPLSDEYSHLLPFISELPGWPHGRQMEVFDGVKGSGPSTLYGVAGSAVAEPIQFSRNDVYGARFADRLLAQLNEQEIVGLLGVEGARVNTLRGSVLREQFAELAQRKKSALFNRLYTAETSGDPGVQLFQRHHPGLSVRAASELLGNATELERGRMRDSQRVPLRLAEEARWYVQQNRLSRALAGLQLESMAAADSDRLALHALKKLPGWPSDVRLEVRDGNIRGQLLDSIGPETASVRKFLVRQSEGYRAFDEQGQALNSVPRHGRNLYASIMHALPDAARQSLNLPHVGQGADLEQAILKQAFLNRSEMARALGQQPSKSWFKPPMRLADGRTGYPLSGRGAGRASPSLIARVEDFFPGVQEWEASLFIYRCQLEGNTDQQILHLLNTKARELEGLRNSLDQWAAQDAPETSAMDMNPVGRQQTVDRIIDSWRRSFIGAGNEYQRLNLQGLTDLPNLPDGFSQVSELLIGGQDFTGHQAATLLQRFPAVKKLTIRLNDLTGLPDALALQTSLTELTIEGYRVQYPAEFQARLNAMPALERLRLLGTGSLNRIDVSRLTGLRELNLSGAKLIEWPGGALGLEHLEQLNLRGSDLQSLPAELLSGHEQLWRGLTLDWSTLNHESFMAAYAWLKDNPAHLVDTGAMVDSYCRGVLSRAMGQLDTRAVEGWRLAGDSSDVMLDRVGQLRQQESQLDQVLLNWQSRAHTVDQQPVDSRSLLSIGQHLKSAWRNGVRARIELQPLVPGPSWRPGGSGVGNILDLSGVALGGLPALPENTFAHVLALRIAGVRASVEEIDGFLKGFSELRELDISGNALAELPAAVEGLAHLDRLNASGNQILVTPAVQQRLSGLAGLQQLTLKSNPLRALDVTGLNRLQTLDVSHSALREWPAGILGLPELTRLDLSYSAIHNLPTELWLGHDGLLANSNVRGCPLSAQTLAELQAWSRGNGSSLGIPADALLEGHTGGEPEYFSGEETQDAINRDLLPAVAADVPRNDPGFSLVNRLKLLDPAMSEATAEQVIELMRTKGLPFLQIDSRISQWRLQLETLHQQLNDWINIRTYREGNYRVSSTYRRRAAERILSVWREQLRGVPAVSNSNPGSLLDLSQIPLGELPALSGDFSHVGSLNLTRVSNGGQGFDAFLGVFTQIRTLVINRNGLAELPAAISRLGQLERMEAAHNNLTDSEGLQREISGSTQLRWLDLSENDLQRISVGGLLRLENLYLNNNALTEWPQASLDLPSLRTLNLSDNSLSEFPLEATVGHDELMRGTVLSNNVLPADELRNLQAYARRSGNTLGYNLDEIEQMIEDYERDEWAASDFSSEDEGGDETESKQSERWIDSDEEMAADKQATWDSLKDEEGSQDFFHLLSQLRHTRDFISDRAGLTRRVWQVLEAAQSSTDLRKDLFLISERGYTCGDGRILRFSDLEVKVFEFNALRSVAPGQEGRELFKLSRNLFRLGKVEEIAKVQAERPPKKDPAEVRLAYRIGLTERLELPAQPDSMLYQGVSGVTSRDLDAAYTTVTNAENSREFVDEIVRREYWIDYLKRKYPDEYAALATRQAEAADALESRYPDFSDAYLREVDELNSAKNTESLNLAVQLTGRERAEIGL
ncbi:NEL-type E3 ubiquitin ligase domain-containing protein [Pseudomonas vancouverensis]|nr:NEL-type E3 ubiquitin ligase domain-containing protein [Pseudomonas vancouverensis]